MRTCHTLLPTLLPFIHFHFQRYHNLLKSIFIRHLILIKRKQKKSVFLQIKFKQFYTFIAYSILQSVFRSYADAIIFHCNSFDHFFVCNYCCKLFVKEDFLHSFPSDALCILCCALCWYYMYRVLSHICSNKIKNETRFLITPNNVLHIHFLSEFTIIIFIMFF